ncbi:MAG TPA: hypothetical protein VFF98_14825 [Novosphingobium sp.]|nr:hypothetical protein [Novosphingobium sp.]HZV09485.1 hypothetical protein [Novosphingobium sp.]
MRSFLMLPALAPMLMLASCANLLSPPPQAAVPALTPPLMPTPKATGAIDPLCAVLRPIALSHADTDGTKVQAIALNSVIDKACGPAA